MFGLEHKLKKLETLRRRYESKSEDREHDN